MFAPTERVLVAVSGGKDSLALWDVLVELGYDTDRALPRRSASASTRTRSREKVERFAAARGLPLRVVELAAEDGGLAVPDGRGAHAPARRAPPAAR